MQKLKMLKPKLKKYWWLYTILTGGTITAILMTTVLAGLYKVERKSLLVEFKSLQVAAEGSSGLKAQTLYADFARETTQRQFHEENQHLAEFLGTRARFESGRHELKYLLSVNDPRSEAFQTALEKMESAVADPLLYLDLSSEKDFDEELVERAEDLLTVPVLKKKQVADELLQANLDVAHTLATLGDPLSAWGYWKLLIEPVKYTDEDGELILEIPSVASQTQLARTGVIAALASWKQLPEDSSHGKNFDRLWGHYLKLSELWLSEISLASKTVPAASQYYAEQEPQLAAREAELRADIEAIRSGTLDPKAERQRLAKYYAKGDALEQAIKTSANERVAKLTERQDRLRNEITRYRNAHEVMMNFQPALQHLAEQPTDTGLVKIRALLSEAGAVRDTFRPFDLTNETQWLNEATKSLDGITRTDCYLALAIARKNAEDVQGSRDALSAMTAHFQSLARLMDFTPNAKSTEGMLSTGGSIEFELMDTALMVSSRLMSEAPTESLRQLADAENRTLIYLDSLLQRGSLLLAGTQTLSTNDTLAALVGSRRPPLAATDHQGQSLLKQAEIAYGKKFSESDALLQRYLDADDQRVREDSRMALLTLLINDMTYRFEYLPSLDPKNLTHFKREGESLEAAKSRLRAGAPESMRRRAAELARAIREKAMFSERPDLWFSVRVRQGQLVALTRGPARVDYNVAFAGGFSMAVKDHWLPVMRSGELAGSGVNHARENQWLTLKEFHGAYWQRLQQALNTVPDTFVSEQPETLPELETVTALIEFVGDANAHANLQRRLIKLDPTLAKTPERTASFLRQMGNVHLIQQELLLNDWRVDDSNKSGDKARLYFRKSAQLLSNWAIKNAKTADTEIWLHAGNDYMQARDYLFAIASYKRYFEERESMDLRKAKVEVYRVAEAAGRAFEAVGAYGPASKKEDPLSSAISAYEWAIEAGKKDLDRTGQLPTPVFDAFIGLARSRYHLGLRTGDVKHFEQAIKGLQEHILHGDIFSAPPINLDQTNIWRDAQYFRGLCALELARAERSKTDPELAKFGDNLKLAVQSFDDVVQRFPDDRDARHLQALLKLARAEWMAAAFEPDMISAQGIEPLKRASNRLKGLLLELDDKRRTARQHEFRFRHFDLLQEALLLRGDVLELLARRVRDRYDAQPDLYEPLEARGYLKEADDVLARFDRDFPKTHEVAWALSQRISVLQQLGKAAKVDLTRADGLIASALTVLDRIPDESWAKAPAGMDKAYWTEYFKWLQTRP